VRCADRFTQVTRAGTAICEESTFQILPLGLIGGLLAVLAVVTGIATFFLRWWYVRSATAARRHAMRTALFWKLQKQYSMAGTLGPMDQLNADGDLPIHYAAECGAPCTLLSAILSSYPEGAKTADSRGNLPLHLLLHGLSKQSDWKEPGSSMSVLLEAFPQAKVLPDMHSKLPIQTFLDICPSWAFSHDVAVELGFPLDCNGHADNWLCLLAHGPHKVTGSPEATPSTGPACSTEGTPLVLAEWLVEEIIKHAQETGRTTVQQLAYATDSGGREAWAVATKANRNCLRKYVLFCGRHAPRFSRTRLSTTSLLCNTLQSRTLLSTAAALASVSNVLIPVDDAVAVRLLPCITECLSQRGTDTEYTATENIRVVSNSHLCFQVSPCHWPYASK
jgi:hypothetical protein